MGKSRGQKFSKGKSKKDTWKKLSHPDLEDFLKDQRDIERSGIKEKSDDQLFILDQDGSTEYFKVTNNQGKGKSTPKPKQKDVNKDGPLVDLESLRCFKNLKPDSAVKDPVIKRNRTRLPGANKSVDMKLKDELRRYRKDQRKNQATIEGNIETVDPWSAPNPKSVEAVLSNEWLSDETKRNLVRNRSVHKVTKPSTEIKAVEHPHPGLSVNPSFVDHQAILKETLDITKAEIKKEQRLIRKTAVPKGAKQEADNEMDIKEEVDIKSEPESDSDDDSKSGILRPKPKTRSQKRKARELNEQQRDLQTKKERAKLEADVFRIKTFKRELTEADKLSKIKLTKKVDKKIQHEKFGQLDLSKHKYQPLKPNPLLSDEMAGSLLTDAKNSIADLTLERFKSLQKRNLIEPRVKQRMKRKNKLKKFQRRGEKMDWEVTGMWNGEKLLNTGNLRRGARRR